jgi:hypothetical protein
MKAYKYPQLLSFLLLLCFVLIVPVEANCQNSKVKFGPIPKWVNIIPVDTSISSPKKDIDAGYFILLSDKQINDSTHSAYFHFVHKIISESGIQNGSDISVSFSPAYQNLVFHSIKVMQL